ncbi:hypothetical protein C499_12770 [Halogeometricum borinquense DSM 11551]|uniref:Uncharacterized protein n=1 Tax=Halogeometricum borinquense (strain ATCC 700274 / DSM 11551 / JCM 10706 / KCTC 4070 / PR3) TaxID=469382 RepID=E4NWM6_HALBP|nr:hypothetical protein [Halogeometricum borinquense]ADQ69446.1 hypothetical protein Hbor_37400 [Halogeometricum borinquense DSM 11551]ELY25998.1 hypothetical protein C499_12770 [Halogeometricum borinquense DSM 11551]
MTCNKSGYAYEIYGVYNRYDIWLSEGNIDDLNALFDIGAGASAIADALYKWGVLEAGTPPAVGTLIAGALLVVKGEINLKADGCGVHIEVQSTAPPLPTVGYRNVESQ